MCFPYANEFCLLKPQGGTAGIRRQELVDPQYKNLSQVRMGMARINPEIDVNNLVGAGSGNHSYTVVPYHSAKQDSALTLDGGSSRASPLRGLHNRAGHPNELESLKQSKPQETNSSSYLVSMDKMSEKKLSSWVVAVQPLPLYFEPRNVPNLEYVDGGLERTIA